MIWKLCRRIILGIAIAFIGFGVYVNYMKEHHPNWNLQIGKYQLMPVLYDGLGDVVSVGDMVLVEKKDDYEISDIIMYEQRGKNDVARIVNKTDYGIVPKKETSILNEPMIASYDIVGSLVFCVFDGMKYWNILTSQLTIGILITIVFAYFLNRTTETFIKGVESNEIY